MGTVAGPQGFTLIEVLVVLLIMGLFVGLSSTILRPDDQQQLEVEAERLALLLELAMTESRITGQPIIWTATTSSYQFSKMDSDAGNKDDLFRLRELPQDMKISDLHIEDIPVSGAMQLEFTSGNPMLSFDLNMSLGVAQYTLTASPIGEVKTLPHEEMLKHGL